MKTLSPNAASSPSRVKSEPALCWIAASPASPADFNGFEPMQRVRAKAHLELERVGSQPAIQALRDALAHHGRRLEPEMMSAVQRVGQKGESPDRLGAYLL